MKIMRLLLKPYILPTVLKRLLEVDPSAELNVLFPEELVELLSCHAITSYAFSFVSPTIDAFRFNTGLIITF